MDPPSKKPCAVFSLETTGGRVPVISESLFEKWKKHTKMKRNLMQTYETTNSFFDSETALEGVKEIMTETKDNYLDRLKMNHKKLVSENCPIVVTGETSAGKSTLINLLIGEELLPYSVLHKTTAICCLHHNDNKRIVYNESGRTIEHHLPQNFLAKALSEQLDKIMADTNTKLIDIYWPIHLLENQENVTLVDTPGLGDNEELVETLLSYLPNAVGFIYVLNSANAGGIEKNKILRLLGQQIQLEQKGENVFDVSSTIFVCNKWDQVPAKEDEKVMKYIQNKLEECMTLAKKQMDSEKQILRFSASRAMERMSGKCAFTADFAVLLKTIKDLVAGSLESKYAQLYRWLRHSLLEKMYETASTHLRYTWIPMTERRKLQAGVEQRLTKLQEKCKEVYDRMEKEGSKFCKSIASTVHTYLHSQEVSDRLFSWTDSQVPSSTNTTLEDEIVRAIMEKIRIEIEHWVIKEMDFQTDLRKFKSTFSEMFLCLDNEVKEVRCMIQGAGRINDLPIQNKRVKGVEFGMVFEELSAAGENSIAENHLMTMWQPLFVVLFFVDKAGQFVNTFWKATNRMLDNRALKKRFEKDKVGVMEAQTRSFLKERVSSTFVEQLIIETCYGEYISVIDDWYNVLIPQQIKANKRFMDNIINEGDSPIQVQAKYRPSQLLLRTLLSRLKLFRLMFLEKPYINEADMEWKGSLSAGSIGNLQRVEYREGQSKQTFAMIAVSSEDSLRIHEMESLMTLKHTNIVETLGVMFDRGTAMPNANINIHVLMELCEGTAENVFFAGHSCSCSTINDLKSKEATDALRLFTDVGSGTCRALMYMHENGVLHGNLKLSKILISNHQAKLIGMGSIRYECAESQKSMTGLSHFAPEVLIGKPYHISSDVYSLGIALWEMWFGRRVFPETELRTNKPEEFANKLFAEHRPDTKEETTPSDKLWKEMQSCLAFDYDKRPNIEQMFNALTPCIH